MLFGKDVEELPQRCRACEGTRLAALGTVSGFRFVECAACEFAFTPDVTAPDAAQRYRAPMEDAPPRGWANPAFLEDALASLGPGSRTILDFGTGDSQLPDELRRRGHRVIAVDTAPPRAPHPDRITGSLFELGLASDSFDLAFAFQVFEHLPFPGPFLRELLRVTRLGGLVVVHTDMHVPERDAGRFVDWWYVMPPVHCSFYRHRTFEVLLRGTPHRIRAADEKRVTVEKGGA